MGLNEIASVLKLIKSNPLSMLGIIIVATFIVIGVASPYIAPYPSDAWGYSYNLETRLLPPSPRYPFGTDEMGRDLFSRVLLGARFSLIIAVGVVSIALVIGVVVGLTAGYMGGFAGMVLMRLTDMFLAFPPLLLAIAFAATLGRGLFNVIIALALSWWPWYARLVYIQVNSVKNLPFIDAARIIGLSPVKIMFKHVLPNSITPVVIQAALDMGSAVLEAAGLSFLGIGVPPPTPEWGLLVSQGWALINSAWWLSFFPGIAIVVTVVGFNLLADTFQEVMDPRLRSTMVMRGM
ncbi:MAG: ABC transporter permease [Ignisphaera sp.]|nr:ABC transporter permease [Ignisphaera sp.]MDW8084817.1 ABC transporter permease [Ignisphaera sp.]